LNAEAAESAERREEFNANVTKSVMGQERRMRNETQD
jgi:hypothetical protein